MNRTFVREYSADASLLLISIIWGSTFIVIKGAIETVPPFAFLTMRFGIAALLMLFICLRRLSGIDRRILRDGLVLGAVLFFVFAFQTLGLMQTPASVTAFITGLYVVLVPILSTFFLRKAPRPASTAGVVLSGIGLFMITLNGRLGFSGGEFLVLVNALFCSVHILLTDCYARRNDVLLLTGIQIGTVFLLSFGASFLLEPAAIRIPISPKIVYSLLLTGVFATVLAFMVQTGMQKHTTPTKAAIIFTLEPVSSAFFGYLLGGEVLSHRQYLGAGFILSGMLVAELGTWLPAKPLWAGAFGTRK